MEYTFPAWIALWNTGRTGSAFAGGVCQHKGPQLDKHWYDTPWSKGLKGTHSGCVIDVKVSSLVSWLELKMQRVQQDKEILLVLSWFFTFVAITIFVAWSIRLLHIFIYMQRHDLFKLFIYTSAMSQKDEDLKCIFYRSKEMLFVLHSVEKEKGGLQNHIESLLRSGLCHATRKMKYQLQWKNTSSGTLTELVFEATLTELEMSC